MAQKAPPAGWYRDPYNNKQTLRYWSGSTWTENTRALADTLTKPAPKPAPTKKTKRNSAWVPPGAPCKVGGYLIPDGMIYVGRSLPEASNTAYRTDSGLIHPKLKVADSGQFVQPLHYYPDYTNISPPQRRRYLSWLAGGRKDLSIDSGYLFLFFYGLEYRLLAEAETGRVSANEIRTLLNEIVRLKTLYQRHPSTTRYADRLIAYIWIRHLRSEALPKLFDLRKREYLEVLRLVISSYAYSQRPLGAQLALSWIEAHPETRESTVAKRYPEAVNHLFRQRYQEQTVAPTQHELTIHYAPASPALRTHEYQVPGLTDAFTYSESFDAIKRVYDTGVEDLEPYSRYQARKNKKREGRVHVLGLLPLEMVSSDPAVKRLREQLDEHTGNRFLKLEELLKALDSVDAPDDKETYSNITKVISSIGYGLAPDQELHGARDQDVVIFKSPQPAIADQEYQLAVLVIRLGAMIIHADSNMLEQELAVLHNMIQNNPNLDTAQKLSLEALIEWSARGGKKLTLSKKKFEHLSADQKRLISQLLISLARVDGSVNPQETLLLERVYTALGMDKSNVTSDLHQSLASDDPVLVAKGDKEISFSIPEASLEQSQAPEGLNLNEELIQLREQETEQVKDMLSEIFSEEEEPAPPEGLGMENTRSEPGNAPESGPEHPSEPSLKPQPTPALDQLQPAYKQLLERLMEADEWEADQVEAICGDLGVMLDGALEILNEWALEQADEPLLESGDVIYVDRELGNEIING